MEKRPDKSPATADRYADVILPLAAPAMTFAVPDAMLRQIVPGCRVIVQLGARKYYTGIVDRLHGQRPPFDRIKPVGRIADAEPVATAEQLRLWHWLSEYYMCPLGMVLRAALPAGLKSDGFSEDETFGRGYMQPRQTVVSLHPDIRNEERLHVALDSLSRAKSQYKALLEYLEKTGNPDFGAPIEIPRKRLSAPTAILKALAEKGFIRIADTEIPASDAPAAPDKLPELSAAQTAAYEQIKTCFSEKEVVLLHGVTGSGKTEIYIRLMAEALAAGHNVLYMLPEIALTAQLIRRMESYFGKAVTVYHLRLSDNRRAAVYHELLRCDGGRIVIGVRSSVLLPLRNLSLVIVDEEHDTSFKQTDSALATTAATPPWCWHPSAAPKCCSAARRPCAESFHNAVTGKYGHVVLSERYGGVTLPQVIVSDTLRAAKRGEKYSHFNKILLDQIDRTLQRGRQAMLFQNRRGFSPYVECGHCGWTGVCPDCNVSLTYHKNDGTLRCHYCGYHMPIPKTCPSCGTGELLPQGFGTEKIEEELAAIFPQAAIERLDADTARSSRNYRRIIASFEQRKTDILVGTQIITKRVRFRRRRVGRHPERRQHAELPGFQGRGAGFPDDDAGRRTRRTPRRAGNGRYPDRPARTPGRSAGARQRLRCDDPLATGRTPRLFLPALLPVDRRPAAPSRSRFAMESGCGVRDGSAHPVRPPAARPRTARSRSDTRTIPVAVPIENRKAVAGRRREKRVVRTFRSVACRAGIPAGRHRRRRRPAIAFFREKTLSLSLPISCT